MKTQITTPEQKNTSWPTRKFMFNLGLFFGMLLGAGLSAGAGFLYLMISENAIAVKNGELNVNKPVIISPTETKSLPAPPSNEQQNVANEQEPLNNSTNTGIIGDKNTIVVANQDLVGYKQKAYLTNIPPELKQYSQSIEIQPSNLIDWTSDVGRIRFEKKDILILGNPFKSVFEISQLSNESRFVFKLDGTQKAALLQFGLTDLTSVGSVKDTYFVKISADGQLLWGGECKRDGENQIISVPLDISNKRTLTIEVTSKEKNESNLFFTEAKFLKN